MACIQTTGTIVYDSRKNIHTTPDKIVSFLMLPNTDDAQTALANENIHISETKAIEWKSHLSRADSCVQIETRDDEEQVSNRCCFPFLLKPSNAEPPPAPASALATVRQ